jgi:predicted small secreted protein
MTLVRHALLAAVATFSLANLAACNTVEGAGKDIQAGGKAIEREAEKSNK